MCWKKMFLGAYRIEKKTTLEPSALELDLTLHLDLDLGVQCWK